MPDAGDMALGALIVFAAAFLGGVAGFGYALAAAPATAVMRTGGGRVLLGAGGSACVVSPAVGRGGLRS